MWRQLTGALGNSGSACVLPPRLRPRGGAACGVDAGAVSCAWACWTLTLLPATGGPRAGDGSSEDFVGCLRTFGRSMLANVHVKRADTVVVVSKERMIDV